MSWRKAMRQWAAERGRQAQRVAVQGYDRARQAGRRLAAKVTAIQKAARLDPKLMRRSLESVRRRDHVRDADNAFRDGYLQQATPRPPARTAPEPDIDPDAGPDPSWPWSATPVPEPGVSADFLLQQQAQAVADEAEANVLVASDHASVYVTPRGDGARRPGDDRGGMPPGAIRAGSVRPLSFEPSRRAADPARMPPGHGRLISKGHFASAEEASKAADAWRSGASFAEYIAMGTGVRADREAGQ